jgi:hypothetical protein
VAARPAREGHHFLRCGYRYAPGPPEALVDAEHADVVERAVLEAMDEAALDARLARPVSSGFAIGFRGPR